MKQQIKQQYQYVGIDTNNNITFPADHKDQLAEHIGYYIFDEAEVSRTSVKRIVHYDIYMIPNDFDYVTCPCMVPYIKANGIPIEARNDTIELPGHACTEKRHNWVKTGEPDKFVTDYTCTHCDRIKTIMYFSDCPVCHSEIQPLIWIVE